jgi:hypothetical protein
MRQEHAGFFGESSGKCLPPFTDLGVLDTPKNYGNAAVFP